MTREEFAQKRSTGQLTLTLVGMSNIGKTHWSEILEDAGFRHVNCDDLVEAKNSALLNSEGFGTGIQEVARWLGKPFEETYEAKQRKFIGHEKEVMDQIVDLAYLIHGNTTIDTTGSVVHLGVETGTALRELSVVVYLEATPAHREKMFGQFIAEPKPVVFADVFTKRDGETDEAALERSYGELLEIRSNLYASFADVTIQREELEGVITADDFLDIIATKLTRTHERRAKGDREQSRI